MIRQGILLLAGVLVGCTLFAFPRKVLMEDFGSTTCGPCAGTAIWLDPLSREYEHDGELVPIAYHMSWPARSDPWYLSNPGDNDAHRQFYDVRGIPYILFDGELLDPRSETRAVEVMEERLATDSPLQLTMENEFRDDSIFVTVEAEVSEPVVNATIHIALIQDSCYYAAPSGQSRFFAAMVDMYPDGAGADFELEDGTTLIEAVFPDISRFDHLPDWSLPNLKVIAFVQDDLSREIINAEMGDIPLNIPCLVLNDVMIDDRNGNDDGRPEPDEEGEIVLVVANLESFADAEDVVVTISTEEPGITMTVPEVDFGTILNGETADNENTPFVFEVSGDFDPREVTFDVLIESSVEDWEGGYSFSRMIGWPPLLLWDHDSLDVENYYFEALRDIVPFDYWDETEVELPGDRIGKYEAVLYFTGRRSEGIMSGAMQSMVEDYLDGGGKVVISSQHLGTTIGNTEFYRNVIRANEVVSDINRDRCTGLETSPLFAEMQLSLTGDAGADNCRSPSGIEPLRDAEPDFFYDGTIEVASLHWENEATGAGLVYFAFPLEAISGANGTASMRTVAGELLHWLGAGETEVKDSPAAGKPAEFLLVSAHPNPFNATTTIRFHLERRQEVRLAVYDLLGREIRLLVKGTRAAGDHQAIFNAENLASGIYICRLQGTESRQSKKLILLK